MEEEPTRGSAGGGRREQGQGNRGAPMGGSNGAQQSRPSNPHSHGGARMPPDHRTPPVARALLPPMPHTHRHWGPPVGAR